MSAYNGLKLYIFWQYQLFILKHSASEIIKSQTCCKYSQYFMDAWNCCYFVTFCKKSHASCFAFSDFVESLAYSQLHHAPLVTLIIPHTLTGSQANTSMTVDSSVIHLPWLQSNPINISNCKAVIRNWSQ